MVLNEILSAIDSRTKKLDNFLSLQRDAATDFRRSIKELYDFAKNETKRKNDALPELVVQDFDEEQIWQQVELQNEGELAHFLAVVSRVLVGNDELKLPMSLTREEKQAVNETSENPDDSQLSESDDETDLDINVDGKIRTDKKKTEFRRNIKNPSVVDDKFFKLEELDEYLTREDKRETQGNRQDSENDDDEESVDLFDPASDDDDNDDDDDDDDDRKMVKYADFFDSPENDYDQIEMTGKRSKVPESDEELQADDDENESSMKIQSDVKRVKFNLTNDSDDTDSLDIRGESRYKDETNKSTLENRQERLQKRIEELEEEAISEKPWQLKGEVTGNNRPQNSLLEEFVQFDVTSRPAPVITEQTTIKLEDIIKQRIKDRAWDDVERKFKPIETPLEYKKKLVMDQEKSKKSLAQIYEDAYVKQKDAVDPNNEEKEETEPKEHQEIRQMMHALFRKLDALSNFHYTPKQAQPELKIVSNLPAVTMEEVAPIATTDATLLAPEEVKSKPRGELVGRAERTTTDMKRERRKKKLKQRVHQKAADKKEKSLAEKLKSGGKRYTKGEAAAALKKLTKDRNIVKMDETSGKVTKSSTAFFAQLQEQVKSQIKSKAGNAVRKKDKNTLSAVKLKL